MPSIGTNPGNFIAAINSNGNRDGLLKSQKINLLTFKADLIQCFTKFQTIVLNLQRHNIQASDVLIVLNEPQLDNWGVRGGVPASAIDLGFKIDV